MRKAPKFYERCPAPGCTKVGDFCRGFCCHCYLVMRAHCIANGSWGNGDHEFPSPEPPPKWEYEPTEQQVADLAELMENQERERLKSKET
jgi:hypothetical protein